MQPRAAHHQIANNLTDEQIDKFLIIAKSVGTYARALDCNNAFKQPSLPLSAASASRDITLFYAMEALHESDYDIGQATLSLVQKDGPVICRDEIEDWSAAEANLFEEAYDKVEIQQRYIRALKPYYYGEILFAY